MAKHGTSTKKMLHQADIPLAVEDGCLTQFLPLSTPIKCGVHFTRGNQSDWKQSIPPCFHIWVKLTQFLMWAGPVWGRKQRANWKRIKPWNWSNLNQLLMMRIHGILATQSTPSSRASVRLFHPQQMMELWKPSIEVPFAPWRYGEADREMTEILVMGLRSPI